MSKHTLQDLREPNGRHSGTPSDLLLREEARKPEIDPTLGITVTRPTRALAKHRLVTIGDSLTQGFQSGAAYNTSLSWPRIVAWELGADEDFNVPAYRKFGGLPFNLEFLLRGLEDKVGVSLESRWEKAKAVIGALGFYEDVSGYWQHAWREDISSKRIHNLAAFGWDLSDVLRSTADTLAQEIEAKPSYLKTAKARSAYRVLASARDAANVALTPVKAARQLGSDGGIETLVVMLGANNALGAVTSLDVTWSEDDGIIPAYRDPQRKNQFTVWRPQHFIAEFDALVAELEAIDARHVILATVPHVTVPPVTHGITRDGGGKVASGSRYFEFYTRPWISDVEFDWRDDRCITAGQARAIDSAIDAYNEHIAAVVRRKREAGADWYLLEVAGLLDRLASRRYLEDVSARPSWWDSVGGAYRFPPALANLNLNSHFYSADASGRLDGGLFALDGVHPTTVGYGIVAQEVIKIMQLAGVRFVFGNGVERTGSLTVDFERLLRLDSLIAAPPPLAAGLLQLLGSLDDHLDAIFARLGLHVSEP
jgi:lysophospholipase L1-like esterase